MICRLIYTRLIVAPSSQHILAELHRIRIRELFRATCELFLTIFIGDTNEFQIFSLASQFIER